MFLTVAILAALGMASPALADRVGHDVAAGTINILHTNVLPVLPTDTGTIMTNPIAVNGFGFIQNYNISDHKIRIGATENDDLATGVLIAAVAQNLRNNRGSNMTHTISVNPIINSLQSYEVATQSAPLAADTVASIEDNVNFTAAWFPFATWLGGVCTNGGVNGAPMTDWVLSPGLALGTHVFDWKSISNLNGRVYIDLRSLGIDARRDGVLLVNHARNEANYAISQVNDSTDGDYWDGTWTIQVRDNRSNGLEQDPVAWVFVPKSNTDIVSGMFTSDSTILIHSGATPAFTVTNFSTGQWLLKVPGRSTADGVLVISGACGGGYNADNVFTFEPNAQGDGWIIQSRDLPNCGLQNLDPADVVCSFAFIPAEKPGVTVTPNKNLLTTEAGGTAQFTVTVNGYPRPTADVTINLSSSDTGEGTVDQATLTFTPAEWNVPKTVTITGVDDGDADGSQPYTINLSATSSTDPSFNGLAAGNVSAINIDNERGVALDKTSITTTEAGGAETFSVWLTVAPTADVTVNLVSSDTTEGVVSPSSLTFTTSDWATPQVVTVTGVDDLVQDGSISYSILTTVSSPDVDYNAAPLLDVAAQNLDNDLAKVILPPSKFTVTEPNTTANIPVVLNSQPTANVTINCVSTDTSEGTAASVTFTPANWSTPQNIVLTAADDLVNDGTIAYSITTTVTSTDPVYAAINPDDVAVETIDNEIQITLPSDALTYGIGEPATGIDGYATVSDVDSTTYSGGGLTVTITSGGNSNDRLDVRNDGTGPAQIGVSGSTVSYGGATIGTKGGGTGTTPLTVTFTTAAATPEAIQALARAVTFHNVNANEAPGTRALSVVLNDGVSGISTASKNIIVRLLRVYSFQQDADGGFGPYTNAADTQIHPIDPTHGYPAGYSSLGLWLDYDPGALLPSDQMQCFLRFTNIVGSGAGQIPPGAKVVYAQLIMNVTDSGHGALFNRMLGDWQEGDSFETLSSGIELDDIEAVSGIRAFLGDVANNTTTGVGLRTIGVTEDVQAWVNGTNNFGWVMSVWTNGANGTAFSPCEATNITLRPRLKVAWLPASVSVASFQHGTNGYVGAVDSQFRLVAPDTSYAASTYLSPDPMVNASPVPNPQEVVLRFDNIIGTDAGQVPPNAKVYAANLELTSVTADAQGAGAQFHTLLVPWVATNTWNVWVDGVSTDGIEAAVTPTATLPAAGYGETVQATIHNVELTADVQAWAMGQPNYGWALMPWPDGSNGWGFNSSEYGLVYMRPLLTVFFDAGPSLRGAVHNGSNVQLSVSGKVGATYHVVRSADMQTPTASWTVLPGTVTIGSGGTGTFTDSSPLANGAFYRISDP